MAERKKIEMLQLLRLIGSISIIIYHSGIVGEHGYFAVEIFSVLSGYILMYSTQSEHSKHGFLRKRLLRIVPLYWAFTFLMYGLLLFLPQLSLMSEATPDALIKSLLFIPFINSKGWLVPLVSIGWTLNYEVFFYIVFFVAMHISHKYRGLLTTIFISTLVLLRFILNIDSVIWNFYTDSFVLEFVFGIIAFYVLNWMNSHNCNLVVKRILLVLAGVSFIWMALDIGVTTTIARCVRIGIPALILFIALVVNYADNTYPPILVQLGNATFSIYLLEFFSTALYKVLVPYLPSALVIVLFVAMVVCSLIAGYIIYKYVEIPLYQKLQSIFIKQKGEK